MREKGECGESARINHHCNIGANGHMGERNALQFAKLSLRVRCLTHFPFRTNNFLPRFSLGEHNFLRGSVAVDVKQLEMLSAEGSDYSGTRLRPIMLRPMCGRPDQQLSFALSYFYCTIFEMHVCYIDVSVRGLLISITKEFPYCQKCLV